MFRGKSSAFSANVGADVIASGRSVNTARRVSIVRKSNGGFFGVDGREFVVHRAIEDRFGRLLQLDMSLVSWCERAREDAGGGNGWLE
ncbi:MAG: hypothetical protein Ct9H300mP1_25190 [Planctomycetaceae bacterium]|nr:MAG: hypothetical protein Ct9H300mP1_25190 [Planctomycetaceae bacterium]